MAKGIEPRYIPANGFKQAEAFKLMKYQNDDAHVMWCWNSRDGITPFTIRVTAPGVPVCDYTHTDWYEDVFIPNFVPPVGMRVFIDKPGYDPQKDPFNLSVLVVTLEDNIRFGEDAAMRPWRPAPSQSGLVIPERKILM